MAARPLCAPGDLSYSVRTGQPAFEHIYGKPFFDYLAEEPDLAQILSDVMTTSSMNEGAAIIDGHDFSGYQKIVDVGGAHGALLALILDSHPGPGAVLFDAPEVIAGAHGSIDKHVAVGRLQKEGRALLRSHNARRGRIHPEVYPSRLGRRASYSNLEELPLRYGCEWESLDHRKLLSRRATLDSRRRTLISRCCSSCMDANEPNGSIVICSTKPTSGSYKRCQRLRGSASSKRPH